MERVGPDTTQHNKSKRWRRQFSLSDIPGFDKTKESGRKSEKRKRETSIALCDSVCVVKIRGQTGPPWTKCTVL